MSSNIKRCEYAKNQLAEVICQLRFPEILSINAKPPADFQEVIRGEYPQYSSILETQPPKLTGTPGNMQLHNQNPTANYQFMSADGTYRVNLTQNFISLSCTNYKNWESFAKRLDAPLAAFIQIYKPAYFDRIGIRYLNFISREELDLVGTPFHELIEPPYLGILADPMIPENSARRSSVDAEFSTRGGCHVKLHAGPGFVKKNGQQQKEIKFIIDQDLYMSGNIPLNVSAGALETLHSQAYPLFRNTITDTLHQAMEPIFSR